MNPNFRSMIIGVSFFQDVPTFTKKILAKESFGMSQPAAALSFTNMMNPHLFFFRSFSLSFLLVALAMACDKPVGLSPCASKGIFFSSLSPSTCVEQNA